MLNPETELKNLINALNWDPRIRELNSLNLDYSKLGLSEIEEEKLWEITDKCEFAFYSVVGSWNYGLANKNSDVDFKVTYFPNFKQFYENKFPKLNVVTKNYDFTLAPFHQYVEHILKGNINFFEILYPGKSEYFYTTNPRSITPIMNILREMVPMNGIRMFEACRGTAQEKMRRLDKYSEDNEYMKEKYGYNLKEAAHAVRQLYFLRAFLETGKIDLQKHFGLDTVWGIKEGNHTREEVQWLYRNMDRTLTKLKPNLIDLDKKCLDKRETAKWKELKEELDLSVRLACKEMI